MSEPVAQADDAQLIREALQRALDAAPDGILVADDSGTILFANPMALTLFGYTSEELIGQKVEVLIPAGLRAGHVGRRTSYMVEPHARPMGSELDLSGCRKSGEEFPVEISLSPVRAGERTNVIAIIRDVTERRQAAEELMQVREQLALVDDRERIARDLHDTVIQRLFAVGLSLQGALTTAVDPKTMERIEIAVDEIDGTIRDIRTAIFSLHARRSVTSGPRDDVLTTVREAARALGFEPRLVFDGLVDSVMTEAVREQLIPTLREALSNVVRHAHATRCWVSVVIDDTNVSMCVEDNGVGTGDAVHGGHGIANMIERATGLGGTCRIEPRDGGGLIVEWAVPRTH